MKKFIVISSLALFVSGVIAGISHLEESQVEKQAVKLVQQLKIDSSTPMKVQEESVKGPVLNKHAEMVLKMTMMNGILAGLQNQKAILKAQIQNGAAEQLSEQDAESVLREIGELDQAIIELSSRMISAVKEAGNV